MGVLGFFDSGFGGLSVVKEIRARLPELSFIYLGDNARTPYGSKPAGVIHACTLEGVAELFMRGAELIVLACNTSSSVALRRIQQEYLPLTYPDRRVLGIVIPTAEEVCGLSRSKVIGVLATEATVASDAYPQEIHKVDPRVVVRQQACPLLVPMIESGELDEVDGAAGDYLAGLLAQDPRIDTILLGCTHYGLIENVIRRLAPPGIRVLSQGKIVASKLEDYLRRRPEMARRLDRTGRETFMTTEFSERIARLATQFYGKPVSMEVISLASLR